jgi:hypothetical protein
MRKGTFKNKCLFALKVIRGVIAIPLIVLLLFIVYMLLLFVELSVKRTIDKFGTIREFCYDIGKD